MTDLDSFKGGVAVITGGGSGIGEGLARRAAQIGMRVVIADIDTTRARNVADDIRAAGGDARAETVDVRDAAALQSLADKVRDELGDVRLLVNNAGIEMMGLSWEFTPEQWDRSRAINIDGVFYGVRAFMPDLIAASKRGKPVAIANLSSVGGVGMSPVMVPYLVSKHAVLCFTECLSLEVEKEGHAIDVSVVMPGPVATRIFDDASVAGGDAADADRRRMKDYLDHDGLTPLQAAEVIFAGLARRDFFIPTDPQMLREGAERRAAHLMALKRPTLRQPQPG